MTMFDEILLLMTPCREIPVLSMMMTPSIAKGTLLSKTRFPSIVWFSEVPTEKPWALSLTVLYAKVSPEPPLPADAVSTLNPSVFL